MGAINVSPESFYAGSVREQASELLETATLMVEAGAALIDIGARSTAPYLTGDITAREEIERLTAAVSVVATKLRVPVSADTTRASVARAALDAGATVVNDISGLRDPDMPGLVTDRGVSVVLMASPLPAAAPPPPVDPVAVTGDLLAAALERAHAAGIADDRIVLDPGIGFFREAGLPWHEWDVAVLAGLDALTALGRPLCVGVSRKSFIGHLTGRRDPAERLAGSLAAAAAAVLAGAAMIRAHDVADTVDAVRIAERLRAARGRR
jgi:dihydropteroate synthase